jgi:hypothetical protein
MENKKTLIKQYKNTIRPIGIYRITNRINGKILIGSSTSVIQIKNRIFFQLKNGSYPVRELQNDFLEYGEGEIVFDIVDFLKPRQEPSYDYSDDLQSLLEMWLEELQPYGIRGYNSCKKNLK